jgi:hypothetical protein
LTLSSIIHPDFFAAANFWILQDTCCLFLSHSFDIDCSETHGRLSLPHKQIDAVLS